MAADAAEIWRDCFARWPADIERRGVQLEVIPFDKVHLNGGGLHCSTTPLYRDPV